MITTKFFIDDIREHGDESGRKTRPVTRGAYKRRIVDEDKQNLPFRVSHLFVEGIGNCKVLKILPTPDGWLPNRHVRARVRQIALQSRH